MIPGSFACCVGPCLKRVAPEDAVLEIVRLAASREIPSAVCVRSPAEDERRHRSQLLKRGLRLLLHRPRRLVTTCRIHELEGAQTVVGAGLGSAIILYKLK